MGEIILLKELQARVFDESLEDYVLFGERNFINDSTKDYDLIFYGRENVDLGEAYPCSIVCPVVRSYEEIEAVRMIDEIRKRYSHIDRFAVQGAGINFFDLDGDILRKRGNYYSVSEEKLFSHDAKSGLEQSVERKVRELNGYFSQFS